MSHELLLGLVLFAFVSSITPGPNNLMLMASGANFGFRRTLPHMLGVALGFGFMILVMGAGLSQVFVRWPFAQDVLRVVSVAYMLWLAWKIAHAAPIGEGRRVGVPLTFLQAAAFQWVNPKAWTMGLTAISAYAPGQALAAVALVCIVFTAINLPSIACWAQIGRQMAQVLTNPRRMRLFNVVMAGLLVLSLWPVLRP